MHIMELRIHKRHTTRKTEVEICRHVKTEGERERESDTKKQKQTV